jgi:hypothetical protein
MRKRRLVTVLHGNRRVQRASDEAEADDDEELEIHDAQDLNHRVRRQSVMIAI